MNTRRSFMKHALASSAVISLSGVVPNLLLNAAERATKKCTEKILVIVQLTGGNDGLNTVIPYGDDEYYKNRFTLAIGKPNVLKIDERIGFHPSLQGFDELLQAGKLAVVQGVGYPHPNRSHFESMDLWHTAHQISVTDRQGWLGRSVEQSLSNDDLPAVHLGNGLQPLALRTDRKPIPTIRSIEEFRLQVLQNQSAKAMLDPLLKRSSQPHDGLLGYLYESSQVAIETSHRLEKIHRDQGKEFNYPATDLGRNLNLIAQLIGSGLATKIYYVTLDGFDTHSNQAAAHQSLLADLGNSLNAFVKQLTDQGNDRRVAVLSFSEFGRRVRENASGGTDHGTAAPVFVLSTTMKQGVFGTHPSLQDLDEGDLKFKIDYRSVYADLLDQWLEIDSQPIVGGNFKPIGLFS